MILDLGAGDGASSLALSSLYPDAQVFAFECHPQLIETSREKLRGRGKIEVVPLAVHNTNGIVEYFGVDPSRNHRLSASSLFLTTGAHDSLEQIPRVRTQVAATRLDSWARERGVHGIDLVWMDLNGAESLALNGMGRLLSTVRVLYTKVAPRTTDTRLLPSATVNAYLEEAGFVSVWQQGDDCRCRGDCLYARRTLVGEEGMIACTDSSLRNPSQKRPKRVVVVFENRIRPDTTGMHCLRALQEVAEVEHVLPTESEQIPREKVDLYLQIDDGTSPATIEGLHPSAFWAIDTHLAYQRLLSIARTVDFVFCAQRSAVSRMRRDGIIEVSWLPLAADPESHQCAAQEEVFDVAFIGNVVTEERRAILESLRAHFPNSFAGRAFGEDWRRISAQSRVLFNHSIRGDLNMRVFESLATGKPLVTDTLPPEAGLDELFERGQHLVTFEGAGFVGRIQELLADFSLRSRIGAQGRALVLAEHTYRKRMESIIDACLGKPISRKVGADAGDNKREQQRQSVRDGQVGAICQRELTSIIIPCKDSLELTKECLESVAVNTEVPHELILVDNGSADGTPEFFKQISKAPHRHCERIEVLRNEENLGFARAVNQGLKAARGQLLLLLNNDVVVTECWLSGLLRVLHSDSRIGLVGPMTNYTAPPQLVDDVPYKTGRELRRFAAWWRNKERGIAEETGRLTGFCLLLKREVIDRIGLLDERFGVGFFEDDDLCLRARKAEYRCLIAREVFVHHYGSQTFRQLGIDVEGQLADNYERFRQKWGDAARAWKRPGAQKGLASDQLPATEPRAECSGNPKEAHS